ncbi:MAG: hypothetical protein EDM05_66530 [Leptolyngbya sp. IPPAS B-1204]|uniref:SRPBCC domain-containing protein n=1 Tax=Leptolyngbya sp. NK1-12 TaxID=2547451 RepID=A0AA96WH21_9CYAN|nr:hypothetical protein [Leptolyngbya sp. NK1-12]MBF2048396.1 hypothetical protein [Elainella sp. C42_A2020_010]RNJ66589.1 MAG: hypothetical protein EDM05_24970 [Leptolyngbya sp. IPPAS B-1204]WNZ25099.1 hypothetical protein HJG54_21100 [Leptolyngbya sp. NK1-12]
MFGTFQQSNLRIEVDASEQQIRDSLLCPDQFRQWLAPQTFSAGLPDRLQKGTIFTSYIGPITIRHEVDLVEPNGLRLLMSQGIDGFHQWYWGDGWVQSSLEGISLLPLNLGQTFSLLRLRQFLAQQKA